MATTSFVRLDARLPATALGMYPTRSMTFSTRCRVSLDTFSGVRITLETVIGETPARAAISSSRNCLPDFSAMPPIPQKT